MIDIENEIFDAVRTELRKEFSTIFVTGEYVQTPPKFPCVSLVEMSNTVHEGTSTSSCVENHADLMYQLDVYSNKTKLKKSECKKIAGIVDKKMLAFGFVRKMLQPIPNVADATVYRMTGRYTAVASKNKEIFSK